MGLYGRGNWYENTSFPLSISVSAHSSAPRALPLPLLLSVCLSLCLSRSLALALAFFRASTRRRSCSEHVCVMIQSVCPAQTSFSPSLPPTNRCPPFPPRTITPARDGLQRILGSLNPAPCTLHPAPCTLNGYHAGDGLQRILGSLNPAP